MSLDAAAEIVFVAIVPSVPGLHVLATSRTRLGVAGEQVWRVSPLTRSRPRGRWKGRPTSIATPQPTCSSNGLQPPESRIEGHVEPARAVARICAAVDGLPLGIELAAARTGRASTGTDRQRGVVAHTGHGGKRTGRRGGIAASTPRSDGVTSCSVLSPSDSCGSLAVFEGGWTIEAAEALYAGAAASRTSAVSGLLADSVFGVPGDVRDPPPGRYAMLETVRAFGRAGLADAGETEKGSCTPTSAGADNSPLPPRPDSSVPDAPTKYADSTTSTPTCWPPCAGRSPTTAIPDDAAALAHDLLAFTGTSFDEGRDVAGLLDQILDRPSTPHHRARRADARVPATRRYWIGDFDGAAGIMRKALDISRSVREFSSPPRPLPAAHSGQLSDAEDRNRPHRRGGDDHRPARRPRPRRTRRPSTRRGGRHTCRPLRRRHRPLLNGTRRRPQTPTTD